MSEHHHPLTPFELLSYMRAQPWSIEASITSQGAPGNVAVLLPEWGGQRVQIMLEQDALFVAPCASFREYYMSRQRARDIHCDQATLKP